MSIDFFKFNNILPYLFKVFILNHVMYLRTKLNNLKYEKFIFKDNYGALRSNIAKFL